MIYSLGRTARSEIGNRYVTCKVKLRLIDEGEPCGSTVVHGTVRGRTLAVISAPVTSNHFICQSQTRKTTFIFHNSFSSSLPSSSLPSPPFAYENMRAKLESPCPEEHAAVQDFKSDIASVFNDLYEEKWDQERWDRAVGKLFSRTFSSGSTPVSVSIDFNLDLAVDHHHSLVFMATLIQ